MRQEENPPLEGLLAAGAHSARFPRVVTMEEEALQPPTQLVSSPTPPSPQLGPLSQDPQPLPQSFKPLSTRTRAEGGAHLQNLLEAREWLLQWGAFYSQSLSGPAAPRPSSPIPAPETLAWLRREKQ